MEHHERGGLFEELYGSNIGGETGVYIALVPCHPGAAPLQRPCDVQEKVPRMVEAIITERKGPAKRVR